MAIKDAVNSALHRTTGFVLTRETPEERQEAIKQARRQGAARARKRTTEKYERILERKEAYRKAKFAERQEQLRREREEARQRREEERQRREQEKAERYAAGLDLPNHYDEQMRQTIVKVRPRTMTSHRKLESLIDATRYVVRQQIPGDVVECGVWRGGSMQAIALTLLEQGDTSRELHLFDTFEGMPPPTEEDTRTKQGETVTAEHLLETSDKDSWMWAVAGLDDVKQGMAEVDYPAEKIFYHPGMVEETTPGQAPETIAVLRLDTDWYASTKHELECLYERLSPGGVLILDDFGDWDGARKATEEWLEKTGEPLFLAPMASGRIAVKPFTR